ncbi:hypothetical protein K2X30_04750 [bacterium]|jgi:hypothetical protein|nr:hypothetical protein [bacterium]
MKALRNEWIVYLFVLSSVAWGRMARGDEGAVDRGPSSVKALKNSRSYPKTMPAIVKHPAWHFGANHWELPTKNRPNGQAVNLGPISKVQSGRTQAMGRPYYNEDNSTPER